MGVKVAMRAALLFADASSFTSTRFLNLRLVSTVDIILGETRIYIANSLSLMHFRALTLETLIQKKNSRMLQFSRLFGSIYRKTLNPGLPIVAKTYVETTQVKKGILHMNVSFSTDLTTATITPDRSQSQSQPPPTPIPRTEGSPYQTSAIEKSGSALSSDTNNSMRAGVRELQDSGASFESIKSFVDSDLEARGVDLSTPDQRSGHIVDIMS